MELEIIMLSKVSQTKTQQNLDKNSHYMFICVCMPTYKHTHMTRNGRDPNGNMKQDGKGICVV